MPIHVILGKPGSGKSLYGTSRLIAEMVEGRRNVVTNLPVRPDRLNEYLQQKWPDVDCRLIQRLRILNDDEIRSFWTFRGPDGDKGENGVAYFLDEAHIAFNAREWASLGKGALHYLSQHRKLGDIVWPITQAAGNLDKQFRSVAEDFTVLRNEYTARFGPFRGRGRFVRKTYLSEPNGSAEPFEVASFSLDKDGIASCYDTAKGIGVHGTKADIGRRAKGWSVWWTIPLGLGVASLVGIIPYLLGKGAGAYMGGSGSASAEVAAVVPLASGGSTVVAGGVGASSVASVVDDVRVSGYVRSGGKVEVWLSDGRRFTERSPSLERIDYDSGVTIDGRLIPFAPIVLQSLEKSEMASSVNTALGR